MQMIHVYVTEPTADLMSDRLKWWAEDGVIVTRLAAVARQFSCPPPTSVPCEHLFCFAGLIYSVIPYKISQSLANADYVNCHLAGKVN